MRIYLISLTTTRQSASQVTKISQLKRDLPNQSPGPLTLGGHAMAGFVTASPGMVPNGVSSAGILSVRPDRSSNRLGTCAARPSRRQKLRRSAGPAVGSIWSSAGFKVAARAPATIRTLFR